VVETKQKIALNCRLTFKLSYAFIVPNFYFIQFLIWYNTWTVESPNNELKGAGACKFATESCLKQLLPSNLVTHLEEIENLKHALNKSKYV